MAPSIWARWQWPQGIGRWHALVGGNSGGAVMLACGRKRKPPVETAGRPGNDKCCPTCRSLDDLRIGYKAEKAEDLVSTIAVPSRVTRELATVGEADEEIVVPPGICICGCQWNDEAMEWRRKVADAEAKKRARALAGWAAYLAEKGITA